MTITMPEQLYYAVELRDHGVLLEELIALTGLSEQRLEILFRFDDSVVRECPVCHARFKAVTQNNKYCSAKCREKAKNKRKKKRKRTERKASFKEQYEQKI